MRDRDITVLMKIVQYVNEITGTIARFDLDLDKLKSDYVAKNAISMCIMQIGELVGKLTEEFKVAHDKMPWKDIVGLRNIAAHAYGSMDMEILWKIATVNVPELKTYCEGIIEREKPGI